MEKECPLGKSQSQTQGVAIMKTNSWPKTKNSLYELCKEFSETYQIDALGMGIESLKKRISAEDCIRLEEVSGAIKTKQYRVTLWTEIFAKDDAEAEDKTEQMAKSVLAIFNKHGDILMDIEFKDITEGE